MSVKADNTEDVVCVYYIVIHRPIISSNKILIFSSDLEFEKAKNHDKTRE